MSAHLPHNHDAILRYLQTYHVGEAQAITSANLQRLFNVTGADIRETVRYYRQRGKQICSGSAGYWITHNTQAFLDNIDHLRRRATDMLETYNRAKDAALQHHDGQISIA